MHQIARSPTPKRAVAIRVGGSDESGSDAFAVLASTVNQFAARIVRQLGGTDLGNAGTSQGSGARPAGQERSSRRDEGASGGPGGGGSDGLFV